MNQIADGNTTENSIGSATATPFQPVFISVTPTPIPAAVYLTGAGDISFCDLDTDEETAALLEDVPGLIFTLGDTQYDGSTYDTYMNCFDKSWGKYKDRMIPVVGNHEYENPNAAGFYDYFDNELDPERRGYYSMNIGAWHVIVLNSQCDEVGGCGIFSPQVQWLENDLVNDEHLCTLALWHQPRFSTGYHGPDKGMDTIWRMIVEYDVDLVLNGHEHSYERFAPMDENGNTDLSDGTRQIIVGTGGSPLRHQYMENLSSIVFNDTAYGVLQLKLDYGTYEWIFMPTEQNGFFDDGTGYCH
jgi:acid phosphatase type 7